MSEKNELIYCNDEQFIELDKNGSIEVNGVTEHYKEWNLYVTETEDGESGGSGGKLYRHVINLYKSGISGSIGNFEHFSYEASKLCNDNEDFLNVLKKIAYRPDDTQGNYRAILTLDNSAFGYGVMSMGASWHDTYMPKGQFYYTGIMSVSGTVKYVSQGDTFGEISGVYTAIDNVYEL